MVVSRAQGLVDRAVELYRAAGRELPRSVETLAEGVHSLDVKLSYDLTEALGGKDEVTARAHYQRALGGASAGTAGAEAQRHGSAGAAMGAQGLYFRSDLEAKLPSAKERFNPGFTPMGLSDRDKKLHEAKLRALADVARAATAEKLSPAQQEARRQEALKNAEDARLAASDEAGARAERRAKIDALPWILRTLVDSMQGWSAYGEATARGEKAERPTVLGRILSSAYDKSRGT